FIPALLLTSAIAASAAIGQEVATRSLGDVLVQDQGMAEIANGLYAKTAGASNSYVAVGSAGQKSMLQQLKAIRAGIPKTADHALVIDELIASLSAPAQLYGGQVVKEYGDCSGQNQYGFGPFYAQAGAGGGFGGGPYGASGMAVNNDTSSNAVNTTNHVHVIVLDRNGNTIGEQSSTQHGNTAAVASTYTTVQRGCDASSSATLTCPGSSVPSVSAFAMNHNNSCIRN
ncbi:MAG: hypothetical protein ABI748_04215, partial [Dokdonella sp.]